MNTLYEVMSLLVIDAVELMKVLLEQFWNSFADIILFIFSLQGSTGMHEGKCAALSLYQTGTC